MARPPRPSAHPPCTGADNKHLPAKFYYPNTFPYIDKFADNSLPAVIMTHGYGGSYHRIEWQAAELAKNCFVVLLFNYRGHGWNWEVDTDYFHDSGAAKTVTPAPGSLKYDIVSQTVISNTYDHGTAVAENPKYDSWDGGADCPQPVGHPPENPAKRGRPRSIRA